MRNEAQSAPKTHPTRYANTKRQLRAVKNRERKRTISTLGTLAYRAGLHRFDPTDVAQLFQQVAFTLSASCLYPFSAS